MTRPVVAVASGEEASVRYACERCKVERVLKPPSRTLGPVIRVRLGAAAARRSLSRRRAFGRSLAELRSELTSRAEEEAYLRFTGSFRFCHECRRFVCPRCWSRSWSTCRSCVARAMQNMSPRRRTFDFGLSLTVMAASLLLLALGVGSVLAAGAATGTNPAPYPSLTPAPIRADARGDACAAVLGLHFTDA
jgi:hypothetical protein